MRDFFVMLLPALLLGPAFAHESALVSPAAEKPTARQAISKYFEAQRLAAAGDLKGAKAALEVVAAADRGFSPGRQSPLAAFSTDPELGPILAKLRSAQVKTANGRVAYRLAGLQMLPEGITFDAPRRRLFLSDWLQNSIYQLPLTGGPKLFAAFDRLTPNGIAADADGKVLWVATTNAFRGAKEPISELVRIDLSTGARKSFGVSGAHGFNDVAIAPNGDVYVSDTLAHQVFRLRNGQELEPFVGPDSGLRSPNGLTVDASGTYLFIAQALTPFRVRLADGDVTLLKLPPDLDMVGTDGFYFRQGALFAVQNLVTPGRVVRLQLSEAMDTVTGFEILDSAHPSFDLPTTGTFVGNRFLILANTQIYKFGTDQVEPGAPVSPIEILSYEIPR
jgi:hypothetical protein